MKPPSFLEGARAQIVYTLCPKYLQRDCCQAEVDPFWAHGPVVVGSVTKLLAFSSTVMSFSSEGPEHLPGMTAIQLQSYKLEAPKPKPETRCLDTPEARRKGTLI